MITIKSAKEIAILREGGKRHAAILHKVVGQVKPGISAAELNDYAQKLIIEGGDKAAFLDYQPYGAKRPYPASLCVSVNDEVVHGIPNEKDKILKEGDIVSLDLGLIHEGMYTDMAVTVGVGKINADVEKLIANTKHALNVGIKIAKNGGYTGDIGNAIEKIGKANNYGIVEELAGHGVGYDVHEDPYVPNYGKQGSGSLLKVGMVLAIEPMFNLGTKRIYLDKDGHTYRTADGKPSAHFEHTVVITKNGAEILTQ